VLETIPLCQRVPDISSHQIIFARREKLPHRELSFGQVLPSRFFEIRESPSLIGRIIA
jgi:hypothetical protein